MQTFESTDDAREYAQTPNGQRRRTKDGNQVSYIIKSELGYHLTTVPPDVGPFQRAMKAGELGFKTAVAVVDLDKEERERERAALEAAVPGLEELQDAVRRADVADENYRYAVERRHEDENAIGWPDDPDPALRERVVALCEQYPVAALYVRAEGQAASTHWADNTGKGAAALETMRLLREGASLEEAEAALHVRREVDPWI